MAKHDTDPVLQLARRRVSGGGAREVAVMGTYAVPGMKSDAAERVVTGNRRMEADGMPGPGQRRPVVGRGPQE
jgi:hypothetical protein